MGWVPACGADAVGAGDVTPVDIADQALVVWRDSRGRPCAMDARCPHLWNHLGFSGIVDGDELVCAAHFWRFDRSGRGHKRAMTGRQDDKAEIAVYPVREAEGQLWVDVP